MIAFLGSGTVNNRLLCEVAARKGFWQRTADKEKCE